MDPWKQAWADYYYELGVSPATDEAVIQAAYRVLAQKYHPDGREPDSDRMKRINVAFDILSDPIKRQRYDDAWRSHAQQRMLATRQEAGSLIGFQTKPSEIVQVPDEPPPTPLGEKTLAAQPVKSGHGKGLFVGALVAVLVIGAFVGGMILRGGSDGPSAPVVVAGASGSSSNAAAAVAPSPTQTPMPTAVPSPTPSPTPTPQPTPTPSPTPEPTPSPTPSPSPTPEPTPTPRPTSAFASTGQPITSKVNLIGKSAHDIPGILLAPGASVTSILDDKLNPRDVYALNLTAGETVFIDANEDSDSIRINLAYPGSTSFDHNGTTGGGQFCNAQAGWEDCTGTIDAPATGTYYLAVYSGGSQIRYVLNVSTK